MTQNFQNQIEENTSGQGENAYVPDIVAKRYNWGAFFFNWIWAIVYKKYVLALIIFIGYAIPLVNLAILIVNIWMGTQGNKWAWQAKRYQSVEDFHKVHRMWATVGTCLLLVPFFIGVFAALTIPSLMNSTNTQQYKIGGKKAVSILSQGTQLATAKEEKITDASSEGLAQYFYDNALSGKKARNRILTSDGIGYIFEGDGSCATPNACSIVVDVNGSKEPNEEWTDPNYPKDRIRIPLEIRDGYVIIKGPDVLFPSNY